MDAKTEARYMYEMGCKYKDIQSKLDISVNTLKSWRKRERWKRKKDASIPKKVAPVKEKVAPQKVALENSELNERRKQFCFQYLQCLNATQAYIKTYDVSYQTAAVNASRLLKNASIKKYIEMLRSETSSNLYADLNNVVSFYLKVLGSDISDYIEMIEDETEASDSDGKPIVDENGDKEIIRYNRFVLKDPDKNDWTVIKSVHKGKDGLVVEPYDKMKAAKELINLLPQGKTDDKTDPLVEAVKQAAEQINNDFKVDR